MNLSLIDISLYSGVSFDQNGLMNPTYLDETFIGRNGKILSFPGDHRRALVVLINGWYHCYYKRDFMLLPIFESLPAQPPPKIAALPMQHWKSVKARWPQLDVIQHQLLEHAQVPDSWQEAQAWKTDQLEIRDIQRVLDHQPYLDEYGGLEYLLHRVRSGATACIRINGEVVAWELQNDDGTMGFLRVLGDHRRKGMGTALKTALAERIRQQGRRAQGFISVYNSSAQGLARSLQCSSLGSFGWVRERTPEEINRFRSGSY